MTAGNAALVKRYEKLIRDDVNYRNDDLLTESGVYRRASGNVFCGNFYGDGTNGISVTYITSASLHYLSFKWDSEKGTFIQGMNDSNKGGGERYINVQGLATDLEGDGVNE